QRVIGIERSGTLEAGNGLVDIAANVVSRQESPALEVRSIGLRRRASVCRDQAARHRGEIQLDNLRQLLDGASSGRYGRGWIVGKCPRSDAARPGGVREIERDLEGSAKLPDAAADDQLGAIHAACFLGARDTPALDFGSRNSDEFPARLLQAR